MGNHIPRVSIGLPVFNGENYLEEAVNSILNQSYSDFELIISDNASTDTTGKIAERYASQDERVRYHRNERNIGLINNFNHVVSLARGEYFQWMAHDDVLEPDYLSTCVLILEQQPSVFLAYTDSGTINEQGEVIKGYAPIHLHLRSSEPHERWNEYFKVSYPAGGYYNVLYGLMRRSQLLSAPLYFDYPGSDQIFLGNLVLQGEFHRSEDKLFMRRIHSQGLTEANPDLDARAHEMNPSFEGRILFPHWRYLFEYLIAPFRTSIPNLEKIRCIPAIFIYYLRHRLRFMMGDIVRATRAIFRSTTDSPSGS